VKWFLIIIVLLFGCSNSKRDFPRGFDEAEQHMDTLFEINKNGGNNKNPQIYHYNNKKKTRNLKSPI
jgi:hypothetical protein